MSKLTWDPCWVFSPYHTSKNVIIFETSVLLLNPVQLGLMETGCYTYRKQDCVNLASIEKYAKIVYFIYTYMCTKKKMYRVLQSCLISH